MTRIDPNQLLRTMSVLLAPDGGIKSLDEVPRIVQLMHKFSKKLVSKCIYIHILRSSAPELLEQFLAKNGWELLNQWFFEAYSNANLYLCGDLVRLFALCPMTGQRLKSDPKGNQAPRIMNQLSTDSRIEAEIRHLSTQVVNQWIRIARKKPLDSDYAAPDEGGGEDGYNALQDDHIIQEYDADQSEDYVPPVKTKKMEKKNKPVAVKKAPVKKEKKSTLSKTKTLKNSPLEKVKNGAEKTEHDSVDDLLDGTTSEESDSEDSDDELVIRQRQLAARKAAMEASRQNNVKKIVDLTNTNKSPLSKEAKAKFEEREKEIRRRREAAAAKERRAERAKPYSRTELRRDLETDEKDRIKQIAAQLKEQNKGKSKISGLGRIPKLPKKEVPAKPNEEGFSAMLGSLDSKPKPRATQVKNKNKDLLETITSKPKSKSQVEKEQKEKEKKIQEQMKENAIIEEKIKKEEEESKKKLEEEKRVEEEKKKKEEDNQRKLDSEKKEEKEEKKSKRERKNSTSSTSSSNSDDERKSSDRRKREKEKEEERRRRKHKEEKRRKEKEKEKERRDSNSSDKEKERSKDKKDRLKDKPKDEKEIKAKEEKEVKSKEERKGEKRSSTEEKQSTKKVKVIKESNMFGDLLSSIMKDDKQKTKKRRPSDNKAEKEKELVKQREQEKEAEKNKDDSTAVKVEDSAEKAEERLSPIREEKGAEQESEGIVSRKKTGILVYARGFKPKRSIRWANELNLVQIEYFELDDTERTNVFKQKLNFAERRRQENASEKNKMKYGEQTGSFNNEFEEKQWSLTRLDIDHPVEYGCESKEREAQIERESRVLTQLYFNNALISDPSEPDSMPKSDVEPKGIPQIDLASGSSTVTDFVSHGWSSKPSSTSSIHSAQAPAEPVTKSPSIERSPSQMESSANPSAVTSSSSPTGTRSAVPSKPAAPANLHELLSSFKPGLLENIVNMANTMSNSSGANNDTSNNAVSPNAYDNTHSSNMHQQNKPISSPKGPPGTRPKFTLPPPVNHAAPRHFNGQHRPRDPHQNGPRDSYHNGPRDYHHNGPRDHHQNGPRGRPNKVCMYFADFGNCTRGDSCGFLHVTPEQRTH